MRTLSPSLDLAKLLAARQAFGGVRPMAWAWLRTKAGLMAPYASREAVRAVLDEALSWLVAEGCRGR